ncbi:MAG: mechanosensitive ion channel family protein [Bacteroidales bacterium]|nr:mechanosensitive ion channel family protein [Bacteroidales bacterium]
MKKKGIIAVIAALAISIPALAVFNEKDLGQTISVLRFELKQQYDKLTAREDRLNTRNSDRRRQMVQLMKKCNELSLMLYSQNQDFTFDHTYALGEVTKQYESFSKTRLPFDDMVAKLDLEIDRHERLIESLRRLPPALEEIDEVPDSIVREIGGPSAFGRRIPRRPPQGYQMPQMDSARRAELEKERRTFVLDSLGQVDRDSCIYYALGMLRMYKAQREKVVRDAEHYTAMNERLKSSYDYAQNKYRLIQKRIFVEGQDDYFSVLKSFPAYCKRAWQDAVQKYAPTSEGSEWRGPIVVGFIFFVLFYLIIAVVLSNLVVRITMHKVKYFQTEDFRQRRHIMIMLIGAFIFAISVMIARLCVNQNFIVEASLPLLIFSWLLIAILASLLIRLDPEALKNSLKLYTPVIIMGLIVISFRIIFIPNRLLNLIYPPVLLGFAIWQLVICIKRTKNVRRSDLAYAWITFVVMLAATVLSWIGFVLMAVQIFIWWLFQLAAIGTITAVYDLLDLYEEKFLFSKFESTEKRDGEHIAMTWLFDFVEMAVVPVAAILSVLFSIWLAAGIFDLTSICKTIFYHPFFNLSDTKGNPILHLSLFKLVVVSASFFIFRYASYVGKAVYKARKYESVMNKSGKSMILDNEVNLTLANNIIAFIVWGIYIIFAIALLKIPLGALSIVAAGLATGIGLALKDVLNNFIYGIQLMSGRLRVGDYIECDGIRGKVESISYQTTTIQTLDGALMAFTNSTLFNENFKNLTKNNSYELVIIPVGVAYGSDVNEVREKLSAALKSLYRKDSYGREVVDKKRGITVAFNDFGDSSVDLVVKQYVLVEERIPYLAAAKELIYNTLNENGIVIPFPQRDIYIKENVK